MQILAILNNEIYLIRQLATCQIYFKYDYNNIYYNVFQLQLLNLYHILYLNYFCNLINPSVPLIMYFEVNDIMFTWLL